MEMAYKCEVHNLDKGLFPLEEGKLLAGKKGSHF